ETLEALRTSNVPVFTVPVGARHPTPNLSVEAWVEADRVPAGDTTTLHAQLHARNLTGAKAAVEVTEYGRVIHEQTVTLTPDNPTRIAIAVSPEAPEGRRDALVTYAVRAHVAGDARES